jgi:hypothetical protein
MNDKAEDDKKCYDPEIIFEKDGEWFFYDETWSFFYGPFPSKEVCERALTEYAKELNNEE